MRIKRRLRSVIELAAARSGLLDRFERSAGSGLTILTYHRVLPSAECDAYPYPSLAMPVAAFRSQMEWLARRFEVVTVSEGVRRLARDAQGTRPLAAVTFDDGYADNAAIAAPILESLGLQGTFFLVHDFVAHGKPLWFDRAAAALLALGEGTAAIEELKEMSSTERDRSIADLERRAGRHLQGDYTPMSREQAQALIRARHEIGSHTMSHAILTRTSDAELAAEVVGSKSALESWLGHPIDGFCYPNGDSDERVRAAVHTAGYAWACSTTQGRNHAPLDPLDVLRVDITPSRVTDHAGNYSELAFRSEISLMRRALRGDRR